MKSCLYLFGFLLILILIASSCGDDDVETPQNSAPTISNQSFSVAEDIDDEVIIGSVQASDPDGDALSFSITEVVEASDNRDFTGLFEIDEETGALSLTSGESLDFEDATGFSVTVSVSDMELTATATITITVTDVVEVVNHGPDAFLTTWRTTESNRTIILLINNGLTYDYDVDWGDGTIERNQTGSAIHSYTTGGDYQVAITGTFPAFRINGDSKHISIDQWGLIEWETLSQAFAGSANVEVNASDAPDLSRVTDMSGMFSGSGISGDFSKWDVSNVTDMSSIFHGSVFNVDINGWDVSSVTDMSDMFHFATGFSQGIGGWDVSSVTDMSSMFRNTKVAVGDIGGWNVSNVTDMSSMFRTTTGESNFNNPNIGGWDVSSVTDMSWMFAGATHFNQDIGSWDVSNVTDMSYMFGFNEAFNQNIGNWDVSNVTNMKAMFIDASAFNRDIGNWDVSNVTNMSGMFHVQAVASVASAFNQDIGGWDVSNVTDMSAMFFEASVFNRDISNWDVSNVTNMSRMFETASAFNQDLTHWDVAFVTDCSNFSIFSGLTAANRPGFTNCNPD